MDMQKGANEVNWFYLGPDDNVYGSFTPKEMIQWFNTGYFHDNVLIRTEHEGNFHAIGEWLRACGGKLPFGSPIISWDHLMSSIRAPLSVPPPTMHQIMLPPGLPPPNMAPMHAQRYPPFIQMQPNGMHSPAAVMQPMGMGGHPMGQMQQHVVAPLISQPPSEPRDGHHSTNSQTPDSEGEFVEAQKQAAMMEAQIPMAEKISVGVETVKPQMCDAQTSTLPLVLNSGDVARFLSEILGQTVRIT